MPAVPEWFKKRAPTKAEFDAYRAADDAERAAIVHSPETIAAAEAQERLGENPLRDWGRLD